MALLMCALVLMVSGVSMAKVFNYPENRPFKALMCYECNTDPFDRTNAACRTDMEGMETCYGTECNVIKIESLGDDVIVRTCDVNSDDKFKSLSNRIFATKDGNVQGLGLKVSWSTCYTGLCNSYNIEEGEKKKHGRDGGSVSSAALTSACKFHVFTIFASVVLPLLYCY